jgi:hypothetical protein
MRAKKNPLLFRGGGCGRGRLAQPMVLLPDNPLLPLGGLSPSKVIFLYLKESERIVGVTHQNSYRNGVCIFQPLFGVRVREFHHEAIHPLKTSEIVNYHNQLTGLSLLAQIAGAISKPFADEINLSGFSTLAIGKCIFFWYFFYLTIGDYALTL